MAKFNYKKSVGLSLLCLFGAYIMGSLVNKASELFGFYNETFSIIVWMLANTISCVSTAYVATNKKIELNIIGKVGAYALSIIFASYLINNIIHIFSDYNIFSFMGSYTSIILESITLITLALYLFNLRTWLAIKITGVIAFIPSIVSATIIPKLGAAWEEYQETDNYDKYDSLISILNSCGTVYLLLMVVALILTIIWFFKPVAAPSVKNNPIDLI